MLGDGVGLQGGVPGGQGAHGGLRPEGPAHVAIADVPELVPDEGAPVSGLEAEEQRQAEADDPAAPHAHARREGVVLGYEHHAVGARRSPVSGDIRHEPVELRAPRGRRLEVPGQTPGARQRDGGREPEDHRRGERDQVGGEDGPGDGAGEERGRRQDDGHRGQDQQDLGHPVPWADAGLGPHGLEEAVPQAGAELRVQSRGQRFARRRLGRGDVPAALAPGDEARRGRHQRAAGRAAFG